MSPRWATVTARSRDGDRAVDETLGEGHHRQDLQTHAQHVIVAQALAGFDGPLGRFPSGIDLAGQHHQQRPGGGQGVAFLLGGDDRRLLELVDALLVSRPHRQHAGETRADDDLYPGVGPSGEHAAGHRLGVSQPTRRQQRLDQFGGDRIADRVAGIGDLQRSLQQPDRRRRRPGRRDLRRPSQPPHRLGVALLRPEHDVTRHPLDRSAGAAQHGAGFAVQTFAHRHGEIVIDGIAYEVVAEGETITRFAEQPGIHRRCERRNQLRRISASEQRQLGQRERRAQDRGDPQHVQRVLGKQAQPAQKCQAQGGRQRRGRASARPSRTSIAPSSSSARTSSITNSGFPAAPATCSRSRGPAGRPTTSPAR